MLTSLLCLEPRLWMGKLQWWWTLKYAGIISAHTVATKAKKKSYLKRHWSSLCKDLLLKREKSLKKTVCFCCLIDGYGTLQKWQSQYFMMKLSTDELHRSNMDNITREEWGEKSPPRNMQLHPVSCLEMSLKWYFRIPLNNALRCA